MKCLVTGGAGFIGSHLTDALIGIGAEVHVVDNFSTGFRRWVNPAAVLHHEDITSDSFIRMVEQIKPDVVFHMAAQVDVQRSVADPAYDANINVVGTVRLLSACRQAGVRKVIFSSTSAVYGDSVHNRLKETTAPAPISYYGLSKQAGEQYIRLFHALYGLNYTILRYSNVFGPRQTAKGEGGVVAIFMNKLQQGQPLHIHGNGNQTRDFIYVQDVVQANLAAIDHGDQQTINISTSLRTSVNNLAQLIRTLHGKPVAIEYGPARQGDILNSCLSNDKARQLLKWQPTSSLAEALIETYRHYNN
ncbi:NAD-dependent epimerase/dehydratase family protein [Paenibacillus sp. NPDC058071]|uniref:NAD-dependent epimerase/dehydratase family protein n=1 Tax=Paenibacillus sp. NPDC058071 TaxID=3346326 RepID=UPI0036D7FBEE